MKALVEHPWFQMHPYSSGSLLSQSFLGLPKSTDSPLCLKKLELVVTWNYVCILILKFQLFQISHPVWNDSYCLLKKHKGQQMSPPTLNRSWQHKIIPSVLEVKGQNVPAINILLHYLSLTWFTSRFVLFIWIWGALQSKLQTSSVHFPQNISAVWKRA